jgi:opacity protein-like surface antigen
MLIHTRQRNQCPERPYWVLFFGNTQKFNSFVRMKRSITLLATAILLAGSTIVHAQTNPPTDQELLENAAKHKLNWFAGLHFMVGNPQGSYRDSLMKLGLPGTGYGFDLNAGYYFDPVPVAIVGEFGMLFSGGDHVQRLLTSPSGFTDTVDYDSQVLNMPLTLSVRVQPNIANWVYPYAEGVFGVAITNSSYTISATHAGSERTESKHSTDADLKYGIGAGLSVKLAEIVTLPNSVNRILLDMRMRYLWGGSTTVTRYRVLDNGGYEQYQSTIDPSNIIHFSVGFVAQF